MVIVLTSGLRTAVIPALDDEDPGSSWILSGLKTACVQNSLAQKLESLHIREGVSLTSCDFCAGEEETVHVLVGTSAGTIYRAIIGYDGQSTVSNETSVSNWMSIIFRSPAKSSSTMERLCNVLHGSHPDTWYSLSEEGKIRKWKGGKAVSERLIKLEKSLGGVRHSFLAYNMAVTNDDNQDILIFALQAEHSSTTLLAWCNGNDLTISEMDGNITSSVAERLKEQGDSVDVQKILCFKRVSIPASNEADREEIISIWQGYKAQVITQSRLKAGIWEHKLVHTLSLEIATEVEVARLHIESINKNLQLSTDKKHLSIDGTLEFLENRLFRPRWFQKKLILMALDELLLSKGMPIENASDLSSLVNLKIFVREMVNVLAKRNEVPGETNHDIESALVWWDLFRRCFLIWKGLVDDYVGIGVVESKVVLLKKSGVSYFREQEREEKTFFGGAPANDPLLRVAYNALVWAQEADPGGIRFSSNMNTTDTRTALLDLLNSSMINISSLPTECDPEIFFRSPVRLLEFKSSLRHFYAQCQAFSERIFGNRHGRTLRAAAKEYSDAQQMYVYLEVLRGVGLFLSLLIHFDTSISASVSETLDQELDTCTTLLGLYHTLRWSCTRSDPTGNQDVWNAERCLMSMATSVPQTLDQRMEGINLANSRSIGSSQRFVGNTVHNLAILIFGQLLSRDDSSPNRSDSTELWRDLKYLVQVMVVHENSRVDQLNYAVVALILGVCSVRTSEFDAARQYLNAFVDASRCNVEVLQDFVNNIWNHEFDVTTRDFHRDISSCFSSSEDIDVLPLISLFFLLHDEKRGIFQIISDSIDRSYSAGKGIDIELSKNSLRLIELGSLQKLAALTTRLQCEPEYRLSLDVLAKLTGLAYDRVVAHVVTYYCKIPSASDASFDLAYTLIADKIKDCRDSEMENLRKRGEDDELRVDEVERVCNWCKAMFESSNNEKELNDIHSFLVKRRQHGAYQLVRYFIASLHSRRVLHRVCAYPWIGCVQTVDSFLMELCDVHGREQVDAAYRAR